MSNKEIKEEKLKDVSGGYIVIKLVDTFDDKGEKIGETTIYQVRDEDTKEILAETTSFGRASAMDMMQRGRY